MKEIKPVIKLDDLLLSLSKENKEPLAELSKLIDETEEWTESKELRELNEKYVFVRSTGEVSALPEGDNDPCVDYSVQTFYNVEANRRILFKGDKPRNLPAALEWMKSPQRREVSGVEYAPGETRPITSDGKLNIFRGFPRPAESSDGVEHFLWLLSLLVPEEHRAWVLDWLAFPIQNPGKKLTTAIILFSILHGLGKSLLAKTLKIMYGEWNFRAINSKALASDFNSFAVDSLLVVGEEASPSHNTPDARATVDNLKNLVTEDYVFVNEKHIREGSRRTYCNYIFCTNNLDSFHVAEHDRRLAIFSGVDKRPADELYTKYSLWLENGGAATLMRFLLDRDLSKFNAHGHAPMTDAKLDMAANSRNQLEEFVHKLKTDIENVQVRPFTLSDGSSSKRVLSLHTAQELLTMSGLEKYTPKSMTMALRETMHFKPRKSPIRNKGDQLRLWMMRDVQKLEALGDSEIKELYDKERNPKAAKPKRDAASEKIVDIALPNWARPKSLQAGQ